MVQQGIITIPEGQDRWLAILKKVDFVKVLHMDLIQGIPPNGGLVVKSTQI